MSSEKDPAEGQFNEEKKNINKMRCKACSSLILLPNHAGITEETEIVLPRIEGEHEPQNYNRFWRIADMFDFENITFSKTVDKFKYLSCCDCEVGPVGFHNQESKISYLCLDRVKYDS